MQQNQQNDESQQTKATGQNHPNSPTPQGPASMNTIKATLQQNATLINLVQQQQNREQNRISDSENTITNCNVVGKFDGEKGPNVARMWLQQIENVATQYKWPDAYTYQVAISSLTGAASHCYSGKINEVIDWLSFKLTFCKTFTSEPSRTDLLESMVDNNEKPWSQIILRIITELTRITARPATLIDHILINNSDKVINSGTKHMHPFSDHDLIFCNLNFKITKLVPICRILRDFSHFDIPRFNEMLSSIRWEIIFDIPDVNENGVVPDDWKIAKVVPLPKTKAPKEPKDLRQLAFFQYYQRFWRSTENRNMLLQNFTVKINDIEIPHSNSARNLEFIIDHTLRFREHVDGCVRQFFSALKILYNSRQVLNQKTKIALCESLVLSRFNHCDVLYGPCMDALTSRRIQVVQNSCLRFIFGIKRIQRISHKL
ncbi:hypothetical protein ILUMI_07763 [Ignelater luminosus]|uniref:Uncharacterized protein n=1 Tax=Ignelater luminosus TaxID=2038154 RepID=A0A8K0GGJ2_IGNLU|nr:hypothetical protein ILUMI_07763 [Ignelater luminosus]